MSENIGFDNRDRFIELGITISAIRKMKGLCCLVLYKHHIRVKNG